MVSTLAISLEKVAPLLLFCLGLFSAVSLVGALRLFDGGAHFVLVHAVIVVFRTAGRHFTSSPTASSAARLFIRGATRGGSGSGAIDALSFGTTPGLGSVCRALSCAGLGLLALCEFLVRLTEEEKAVRGGVGGICGGGRSVAILLGGRDLRILEALCRHVRKMLLLGDGGGDARGGGGGGRCRCDSGARLLLLLLRLNGVHHAGNGIERVGRDGGGVGAELGGGGAGDHAGDEGCGIGGGGGEGDGTADEGSEAGGGGESCAAKGPGRVIGKGHARVGALMGLLGPLEHGGGEGP